MSGYSLSEIANSSPRLGKIFSVFGNRLNASTTVSDCVSWAEELQKREFRGLGDTREAALSRLAVAIDVPESYLKRLRYKSRELTDIPASIYIRLAAAYDRICMAAENKAAELRAERLSLEEPRDEAHQELGGVGH